MIKNTIITILILCCFYLLISLRSELQKNARLQRELRFIAEFQYTFMSGIDSMMWSKFVSEYEQSKSELNISKNDIRWEDRFYLNICKQLLSCPSDVLIPKNTASNGQTDEK